MKRFLLILIPVVLFSVACKKEKNEYTTFFKAGSYIELSSGYDDYTNIPPVSDADYQIYDDQINFYQRASPVQEGKTGTDGVFSKTKEGGFGNYFIYVKKGSLNSLRFHPLGIANFGSGDATSKKYPVRLSTTPVKFSVIVKDAGALVQGATVSLYISQADYANDRVYTYSDMNPTTGVVPPTALTTNADGEAAFIGLEPRTYWIRVQKSGKNNASTINTIDLPDEPDKVEVINQTDIGIK